MKMTLSLVAALTVSSLLFAGSAHAVETEISGTGPGSTNDISFKEKCKVTVGNSTNINVGNSNSQTSLTGDTGSTSNTAGGSATSGSARNSNSTEVEAVVTNGTLPGCENVAAPITPPAGGGQGGGQVSGVNTVAGGRGGGVVEGAQVAAPVGGVGAGVGGATLSVLAASVASIATGAYRLRKPLHG